MTKTAAEIRREATFLSQGHATVHAAIAQDYAGHALAAMMMPGQLQEENDRRARALLASCEILARSLSRMLSAETSNGGATYVVTVAAPEFSTILAGLAAWRAVVVTQANTITEDMAAIAGLSGAAPALADTSAIDVLCEKLVATATRQDRS